jgi:hypothetical protein
MLSFGRPTEGICVLVASRFARRFAALCAAACCTASCAPPGGGSTPAAAGPAATAARTAGERGFTGVWVPVGTFDEPAGPPPWQNTPWPKDPPFTAAGAAESERLADHGNFTPCTPGGPVFHMWEIGLFPIQLLEAPGELVILREASGIPRRIFVDGRGHPPADELVATWNGHSIGRWEGDVLVVDTVGINGRARAANGVGSNARVSSIDDDPRFPLSDELHLVERMRLVADGELLEDEITITDPKFYTAPVVLKHYFQRRPDIDMLEYFCGDNPR